MMQKQNKTVSSKTQSNAKKVENVIIHIANLKCKVDVNPDVYSDKDKKRLDHIVNHMSKNIWIDRTYVDFPGNRFKDAFIKEDGWKELVGLICRTNYGKTANKTENNELMSAMLAIAITYLYDIAKKYEFDPSDITIDFKRNCKFWAEYIEDNRKEWRF